VNLKARARCKIKKATEKLRIKTPKEKIRTATIRRVVPTLLMDRGGPCKQLKQLRLREISSGPGERGATLTGGTDLIATSLSHVSASLPATVVLRCYCGNGGHALSQLQCGSFEQSRKGQALVNP
jgi:hypothetical protein